MQYKKLLNSLKPLKNFDLHSVKLISSSRRFIMKSKKMKEIWNILFVTYDDQIYAVGTNRFGELGLGDKKPRSFPEIIPLLCGKKLISISINDFNAHAITQDGKLFLWGHNLYGKLK